MTVPKIAEKQRDEKKAAKKQKKARIAA